MTQYAIKIFVTALIVVAAAEVGKRSALWGALLAALPVTSLLAFIWLYRDTQDPAAVAALSMNIFWLVLAALPLFVVLAALLRAGQPFWLALLAACASAVASSLALLWLLRRLGVAL